MSGGPPVMHPTLGLWGYAVTPTSHPQYICLGHLGALRTPGHLGLRGTNRSPGLLANLSLTTACPSEAVCP